MSATQLNVTRLGDRGPIIAFCHGLFGRGKNWTQIAKAFADDHRVLLIDMPNHGRSGWTEGFAYADSADDVAALFGADDPVTLIGHSMGGKIAMAIALRHPELVSRLVVVDVSPVAYESGREFLGYIDTMRAWISAPRSGVTRADEALRGAVPNTTVRSFLLQNLRREGDGWRWMLNLDLLSKHMSELAGWPADELRGSYPGPVLWIGGANSAYVADDYATAMEALFPRVRRVTIKGAGHWVHSEQPAVFVEVLKRFVS
ncbi:alpha/beta fold hydrolase [Nocardioides sp. B-3]|uniref:alpha/beta fold hydrolase n=1 Tax=Nocardioides sp. B-3 TaxID=2895565 RepID=UPI002152A251|nr:alpha/beta fold hydrolase [Nocardioides sp. B-3]UUZ58380.1 alpha/beta fold hydrolase [Nocardioides sp. B-3]